MRAPYLQDVSVGPRFASVKIAPANLEGVPANRDGTFILNRVRGDLGFGPACRKRRRTALVRLYLSFLLRCSQSQRDPGQVQTSRR